MMTEKEIMDLLSKTEKSVYTYIKEQAEKNEGTVRQSMKEIGNALGTSSVTVHRAVTKLRKKGVIGIVPSMEKAESNEIVYYGVNNPDKQVNDIFKMIGQLSSSANTFETMLDEYKKDNEKVRRENKELHMIIEDLEKQLEKLHAEKAGLDSSKIIDSRSLDDGTIAYIIKK